MAFTACGGSFSGVDVEVRINAQTELGDANDVFDKAELED